MQDKSKQKMMMVMFAIFWFGILGTGVGVYKLWWEPRSEKLAVEEAEAEAEAVLAATTSKKRYQYEPTFRIDSFSGYGPLRSRTFSEIAGSFNIGVNYVDDGADYGDRLKALANGDADIGVFTIDALVKASADYGDLPVTIVDIIDETKGADAMIGSKMKFKNIDSLNDSSLRIVCMKDTPSETLGRVVMAYFNLQNLSESNFEFKDSPQEVYDAWKSSSMNDNKVFIMWEPFVSKALENGNYRSIVDSSKFRGYIVDVIVANRNYLVKNQAVVSNYVKSYRKTLFDRRNDMEVLILEDSKKLGDPLTKEQAENLVKGIWWKNTKETFGHFGLSSGHGLQHIEEMIKNITDVLVKTGAIDSDPTNGNPNLLYYDKIVKDMYDSKWHPGFGNEQIRREKTLFALSDNEWNSLTPVGTLQIKKLVFARGTSRLSSRSYSTLDELVEKLTTWPQYYLIADGNASNKGNVDANKRLAAERSKAAVDYLLSKGIDKNRIRARNGQSSGSTTVNFIVGELPY